MGLSLSGLELMRGEMKLLRLDLTHMLECLECVLVHLCVVLAELALLYCMCVSTVWWVTVASSMIKALGRACTTEGG